MNKIKLNLDLVRNPENYLITFLRFCYNIYYLLTITKKTCF